MDLFLSSGDCHDIVPICWSLNTSLISISFDEFHVLLGNPTQNMPSRTFLGALDSTFSHSWHVKWYPESDSLFKFLTCEMTSRIGFTVPIHDINRLSGIRMWHKALKSLVQIAITP
jgi:hypothetical protein